MQVMYEEARVHATWCPVFAALAETRAPASAQCTSHTHTHTHTTHTHTVTHTQSHTHTRARIQTAARPPPRPWRQTCKVLRDGVSAEEKKAIRAGKLPDTDLPKCCADKDPKKYGYSQCCVV